MAQVENKRKQSNEDEDEEHDKRVKVYGDPRYKFKQDNDTLSHTASFLSFDEKQASKRISKQHHKIMTKTEGGHVLAIVFNIETFHETLRNLEKGVVCKIKFTKNGEMIKEYIKISDGSIYDLIGIMAIESLPPESNIDFKKFRHLHRIIVYDDIEVSKMMNDNSIPDELDEFVWASPTFSNRFDLARFGRLHLALSFKHLNLENSLLVLIQLSLITTPLQSLKIPLFEDMRTMHYIPKYLYSLTLYLHESHTWESIKQNLKNDLYKLLPRTLEYLHIIDTTGKITKFRCDVSTTSINTLNPMHNVVHSPRKDITRTGTGYYRKWVIPTGDNPDKTYYSNDLYLGFNVELP